MTQRFKRHTWVSKILINSFAGPYEFKHHKPRLLIVGYGDIGKRILKQKLKYPKSGKTRGHFYEHFRVIIVSRTGLSNLDQETILLLKSERVLELKLDLDIKENINKISKFPTYTIVLIPSQNSSEQTTDPRMKKLCLSIEKSFKGIKCRGVYVSTTGVYGNTFGKLVDETHQCEPTQLRSKRRLYNEKIFRYGPKFHILRVPGIYARNRLPIQRLKLNKPALMASDDVYTNHIHAEDLARICFISLFKGKPSRTTNTVDDSKIKMADYFDEVAKTFNLPKAPRISINEMNLLAEENKISSMMASFFKDSRLLKNERLKNELKISLEFPNVVDYLKKHSRK